MLCHVNFINLTFRRLSLFFILEQIQFVAIMVHAFQLLFIDCNYPRAFVWWIGMHAVMFFFLFNEFYKSTYKVNINRVSRWNPLRSDKDRSPSRIPFVYFTNHNNTHIYSYSIPFLHFDLFFYDLFATLLLSFFSLSFFFSFTYYFLQRVEETWGWTYCHREEIARYATRYASK